MSQSRTPTKEYKKRKRENAVLEVSQIEIGDPGFFTSKHIVHSGGVALSKCNAKEHCPLFSTFLNPYSWVFYA